MAHATLIWQIVLDIAKSTFARDMHVKRRPPGPDRLHHPTPKHHNEPDLDLTDLKLLNFIQSSFPLVKESFEDLGEQMGMDSATTSANRWQGRYPR